MWLRQLEVRAGMMDGLNNDVVGHFYGLPSGMVPKDKYSLGRPGVNFIQFSLILTATLSVTPSHQHHAETSGNRYDTKSSFL